MRMHNRPSTLIPLLVLMALVATAAPLRAQTMTPLNVLRLKIEKNTRSAAMPNDVIIMKGDFLTQQQPGDGFDLSAGITIQVSDSLTLDQSFTFDPCRAGTARPLCRRAQSPADSGRGALGRSAPRRP